MRDSKFLRTGRDHSDEYQERHYGVPHPDYRECESCGEDLHVDDMYTCACCGAWFCRVGKECFQKHDEEVCFQEYQAGRRNMCFKSRVKNV